MMLTDHTCIDIENNPTGLQCLACKAETMPEFTEYGEDILGAVDKTRALLAEFDAMILLDAIADHLGLIATTEQSKFEHEVIEHAIKEIRKSRGLEV